MITRRKSNKLGSFTSTIKLPLVLTVLICAVLLGCTEQEVEDATIWFKGNTHTHTTLCGHADTSPDSVALWYLDRGYNFLILSEHNHFIDPDSVNLPAQRRSDFILIPGEEVSGQKHVHTTSMNTRKFIPANPGMQKNDTISPEERQKRLLESIDEPTTKNKTEIIQRHVDDIHNAGGLPILNHPNWDSGIKSNEIFAVKRLHLLELYNGHPHVNNWGAENQVSVEEKWDSLLTAGMLVLGISSDDAHTFKEWEREMSNPGRGWIMVNSEGKLTADAVTRAVSLGKFYSTNGLILKKLQYSLEKYEVLIDTAETFKELSSPYVSGKIEDQGKEGFVISFIGENGEVLKSDSQFGAVYNIKDQAGYVRSKMSFTRKNADGKYESFFAWTQPQFLDERDQLLNDGHVLPEHGHDHN